MEEFEKCIDRPLLLHSHERPVVHLAFSPSGEHLASCSEDMNIVIWDLRSVSGSGISLSTLREHKKAVERCSWNPVNPVEICSLSADREVRFWDVRRKRSISSLDLRTKGSAERSKDISWSPSGRFVAVCSGRHSLRVIDTRTMAVCAEMSFRPHFPQSIMWMTDSEIVVSTTGGTLDVISCIGRSDEEGQDPSDLDLSYHLRRIGQKIASYEPTMCISRGRGNNFVVGSNDGVVALWDAEDMCCSKPLDQLDYGVITCAFSHDGRFVTYISKEVTEVSAIDVETGQRKVVAKDCSPLLSLAMHPLQYVLACAGSSRDERRDKNPIQLFGMRKK